MYEFLCGIIIGYFFTNNIYEFIKQKHHKWKRLNNLVSSKHKNIIMINWISLCMLIESKYIDFLQYINKTFKKLDKNTYEITYSVNGKIYKMIVKPSRGPNIISKIVDQNNIDVTKEILPYLGPNNNWHNTNFTVDFFHCEKLIFEMNSGEIKEFDKHEKIVLYTQ